MNALPSKDPQEQIKRWRQFGYGMEGLCGSITLTSPAVKALIEKTVHDPVKQKTGVELARALEAALYELAAALTVWAQDEINAIEGKAGPVPPPPPFDPPPYPKDPDSLASTLIAIITIAKAVVGEVSTILPDDPKWKQLIGALSTAVENIQNDWESIFGLSS